MSGEILSACRGMGAQIVGLQEGDRWNAAEMETRGFIPFVADHGRAGVFVVSGLSSQIGESVIHDDIVGVVVGNVGCVSVYMPDSSKSLESLLGGILCLLEVCRFLTRHGAAVLNLMGDFQVSLPSNVEGVAGDCRMSCTNVERQLALLDVRERFFLESMQ